jgi:deoxyribodipyrimidine photo-lyase
MLSVDQISRMDLPALARDPRVTLRNRREPRLDGHAVVYAMKRAQRASDNPALQAAVRAANALGKPLIVFFALVPVPGANLRHYQFMLEGLPELAAELQARGIGFVMRAHPQHELAAFANEVRASLVISDEDPRRGPEQHRRRLAETLEVPFATVDADVVVPRRLIGREHWAARTIRPRIHEQLERFLVRTAEPAVRVRYHPGRRRLGLDPEAGLPSGFPIDRSISPSNVFRGGNAAARARLRSFVRQRLDGYAERRNHPELDATSRLSPYLHFGHIGPGAVALAVQNADAPEHDKHAFLEELIVRRELAVNYVAYNPAYDRLAGCERWARHSLAEHAHDRRERITPARLEAGESPDPLWNAAQIQMVEQGFMHGYMRMYWGKRLLEWTRSADEAFELAVMLNDRYELDGRDPNGYAGIAWAIGGKHDQAWGERPIFGKVRFMSHAGAARKFDAAAYVRKSEALRAAP